MVVRISLIIENTRVGYVGNTLCYPSFLLFRKNMLVTFLSFNLRASNQKLLARKTFLAY